MPKVIKICPNCGNQFETYDGKKGKTYCSNECYKEHKGIGVKKFASCVVCGKEFELKHGMGTKVCSTECLKTLRSQLLSKPKKHQYVRIVVKRLNNYIQQVKLIFVVGNVIGNIGMHIKMILNMFLKNEYQIPTKQGYAKCVAKSLWCIKRHKKGFVQINVGWNIVIQKNIETND